MILGKFGTKFGLGFGLKGIGMSKWIGLGSS